MYRITVDRDRCVSCGNCEIILRDKAFRLLLSQGRALVSDHHAKMYSREIDEAIANCHLEALRMEVVP